jgi:multiple sugar transport system permease protein
MTPRGRRAVRRALVYAGIAPFLVAALFPVVWMVITAFKDEKDLYSRQAIPFWFYEPASLKHFHLLFTQTWFGTWVVNTGWVSVSVVGITLLAALPAAYALARLRVPASQSIGIAIFMTYLVPPIILFLPLAKVVGKLGLFDSAWALVLLYPTFTIPFCTWLMLGFFRTIPAELEEAAWIDGCGQVGSLLRIVLPLSLPGIATIAIFAFTLSMQEYLYAVVFSLPVDEKVVTVGLPTVLIRGDIFFWGALMAAGTLVGVPVALLFAVVIDRFMQGLTGATRL